MTWPPKVGHHAYGSPNETRMCALSSTGRCTLFLLKHTDVTATDNEVLHDCGCRNCDLFVQ